MPIAYTLSPQRQLEVRAEVLTIYIIILDNPINDVFTNLSADEYRIVRAIEVLRVLVYQHVEGIEIVLNLIIRWRLFFYRSQMGVSSRSFMLTSTVRGPAAAAAAAPRAG